MGICYATEKLKYIYLYMQYVSSWKKSTSDIVRLNTTYIYKKLFLSFLDSLKSLGKTCLIWLILSTFFSTQTRQTPKFQAEVFVKTVLTRYVTIASGVNFPRVCIATIKHDEEREKFGSANYVVLWCGRNYFWPNNHHVHIKPQVYS